MSKTIFISIGFDLCEDQRLTLALREKRPIKIYVSHLHVIKQHPIVTEASYSL